MEIMEGYAIIILAAGSSSRMGQAKQLLLINGKTLLRHTIDEARKVLSSAVYVVMGANADQLGTELSHRDLHVLHNPHWQEGMASSIRTGLKAVQTTDPEVKGCIISVCDQPYVSAGIFTRLISQHKEDPSRIIASAYGDTHGVPVLFGCKYFPELMKLTGQEGAKKLLNIYHDQVVRVPFPKGEVDIDTPDDYEAVRKSAR